MGWALGHAKAEAWANDAAWKPILWPALFCYRPVALCVATRCEKKGRPRQARPTRLTGGLEALPAGPRLLALSL